MLRRGNNIGTSANNSQSRKHLTTPSVSFSSQDQLNAFFPSPKAKQNGAGSQGCYYQTLATTLEISVEEYNHRVDKIKEELALDSLSSEDCMEVLYKPLREAVESIVPPPPNIPAICSMILETDTPSVLGCIVSRNLLIGLVEDCLDTIQRYERDHN